MFQSLCTALALFKPQQSPGTRRYICVLLPSTKTHLNDDINHIALLQLCTLFIISSNSSTVSLSGSQGRTQRACSIACSVYLMRQPCKAVAHSHMRLAMKQCQATHSFISCVSPISQSAACRWTRGMNRCHAAAVVFWPCPMPNRR